MATQKRILSAYCGTAQHGQLVDGVLDSGKMLEFIASIYFQDGDHIADVTYGEGSFWSVLGTDVNAGRYTLAKSDLHKGTKKGPIFKYDNRKLPYANDSFDVVLLDPPWLVNPGKLHDDYMKKFMPPGFTPSTTWEEVMDNLYCQPIAEGFRVLVPGGLLVIKTGDQVWSDQKLMGSFDVDQVARVRGFERKDRFVQISATGRRGYSASKTQRHSLTNFSDWLVYRVPKRLGPALFDWPGDALGGLPRPNDEASPKKPGRKKP